MFRNGTNDLIVSSTFSLREVTVEQKGDVGTGRCGDWYNDVEGYNDAEGYNDVERSSI